MSLLILYASIFVNKKQNFDKYNIKNIFYQKVCTYVIKIEGRFRV